ncbi:MAG: vitamin K epoxide reductase family protein [Longimicrobiaceae bacterium]
MSTGAVGDAPAGSRSELPLFRMGASGLALAGLFVAAYLALYNLGVSGTLQCGEGGGCSLVQGSEYAWFAGVPVSLWGVLGYAVILAVAIAGTTPALARSARISTALVALSGAGAAFSGYLTYLEAAVIKAWCQWCVVSAVIISAIFLLALVDWRRVTS